MKPKDIPEVLDIETMSFNFPWSEEDFIKRLDHLKCTSLVLYDKKKVIGYLVYQRRKGHLELLNFAVHPDYRRCNIGTTLVSRVMDKLTKKKSRLVAKVPDTNLGVHLFLKSLGFRAKLVRGHSNQNDMYLFVYNED